jgi:hypothetical protein
MRKILIGYVVNFNPPPAASPAVWAFISEPVQVDSLSGRRSASGGKIDI